jgi:NADH-quinone oxidoreductase subunit L
MTSFYMFRLLFMTFFGESRVDHHTEAHIHESPRAMTVPLMVLAVGSVLAGYIGLPKWLGPNLFEHWLEPVFEPVQAVAAATEEAHHSVGLEIGMAAVSVAIAVIGFLIAYTTYAKKSDRAERVSAQFKGLYQALLNKWYVDELYDALWVNRAKDLGRGLWRFDSKIVDGLVNETAMGTVRSAVGSGWWDRWIVDGLVRFAGGFVKTASWPVRLSETGYTQNYALVMIFGVLILVGYVLWGTL